jgi:hypothetical protein
MDESTKEFLAQTRRYLDELNREEAEKKQRGESCSLCGNWIGADAPGYPRRCFECERLIKNRGAVSHERYVRCPACGSSWTAGESVGENVFEDGCHRVECQSCRIEFEVGTTVSYRFTSPALTQGGAGE